MNDAREPSDDPDPIELPVAVRLHQLEGFYRVIQHAGFARAVQALGGTLTESALHQQVRKLEAALGVELARVGAGRRMVPTPEGRRLFEFIQPYYERLPAVLRSVSNQEGAELIVASEPLYVSELAAPACAAVLAATPDRRIRLIERDVSAIVRGIERSRFDVALASRPVDLPPALDFQPLGRLRPLLLVPNAHAWAKKRRIRPEDLAHLECLLYEAGTEARRFTDRLTRELGLELRCVGEATSATALRALVRSAVAPAFVPALLTGGGGTRRPLRRRADDGVVEYDLERAFDPAPALPEYGLLTRRDASRHPLIAEFARQCV